MALKHAVVVIHGIGEQRPMATLRRFVESLLEKSDPVNRRCYHSIPDTSSGTFELRCLRSAGNTHPRTDFYEFYWAHLMPIAGWSAIAGWVRLLLGRRYRHVPPQFRAIWLALWLSVVAVSVVLILGTIDWIGGSTPTKSVAKTPALLVLLWLFIQTLFLSYIGDAATYLNSSPRNVAARHAIRAAGLELLERLHASKEYERIIVVGHSLGSVIGYDILHLAWQRLGTTHGSPTSPSRNALEQAVALAKNCSEISGDAAKERFQSKWRDAAAAARDEMRKNGSKWLVTDFITMGSPLAHADLLLAKDRFDFELKVRQLEFPTCPPTIKSVDFLETVSYTLNNGQRRSLYVPNHAAWLTCTNWTNLYFPVRWLLKGDAIGGPLSPLFGIGIRDIAVKTKKWSGFLSHNFYWEEFPGDADDADAPVKRLSQALRLFTRRH